MTSWTTFDSIETRASSSPYLQAKEVHWSDFGIHRKDRGESLVGPSLRRDGSSSQQKRSKLIKGRSLPKRNQTSVSHDYKGSLLFT